MTVHVGTAEDLGPAAVVAVADGASLRLAPALLERLATSRAATLEALAAAGPVYGVSTGMGAQSHRAVGTEEHPTYQDDLLLGRSVGTAPWLGRREVRAALAVRVRTLLEPEAGVSPGLVQALVAVLDADLVPAVPATGSGAAGEIIPLAHLGAFLTGHGEGLDPSGEVRPAAELLAGSDVTAYTCGVKEGVALLQGVPVATGLAVLVATEARLLVAQALVAAAAEAAVVRAPRDPWAPELARGDDALSRVHAAMRALAGPEPAPRALQAPVSFRVAGPALAHLVRAVDHLDDAVARALGGVTTSPALVDGRFLGTAGFDGFDLAASADAMRVAVLHAAETGTARLHRLLDPAVTGLPAQLAATPGRQAGLVAVHKHLVGLVHEQRRSSMPASLGAAETSQGQEDVQSFAIEAVRAAAAATDVLRTVTASEVLAVHRARQLGAELPAGTDELDLVLHQASAPLPSGTDDRPTGPLVATLTGLLRLGWGKDLLEQRGPSPRRPG